ncbi:PBSX family phage terminase large subunit [Tissierella sp. MSJ-40]|uniref:PBSX family phage terminase large subunit n=1 Tax=Tissierella simiarum TaxID=2841534 RepID=A0ABS6EDR9_9FIRM|nr:PBSX family phage terminase large subunit [Tissierella simiarum]MBU5440303.1 PBSX family phage terminase large subunit [Tissierella simiarum]
MKKIKLSNLIAPSFYKVHQGLKEETHTHYWLKGGRGSTKSSFISIEIVLGIMQDSQANAVALRKVKDTLKDSVFEQFVWAIEKLGVSHLWHIPQSKLEITYIPTGQKILFRGADNPKKIKSTKVSKGYIKYIWYEEVDEFNGMEEIRTINQSLMRGGERFVVFYSFNPPQSIRNWVNNELLTEREDRLIHHSTYLTVPKWWLGNQFIIEAEHLKKVNPRAYNHEYLGEVTGTGGEIFVNITIRDIMDEEISKFDRVKRGLDFGYASDPLHYAVCHFDKTRRRLYIFYEIHKVGMKNRIAVHEIKKENKNNDRIVSDSAEPRTIAEFKDLGLRIIGAKKGPGSVEHGIKFLQDLEEIIIDNKRCPNTAREFLNYELEKDKEGNFKADYPDKNNHSIDAIRYALEDDMRGKAISFD